jgi:hypothetical protein
MPDFHASVYFSGASEFSIPEAAMRRIAEETMKSVKIRLSKALDAYDQPATPLKPNYAKTKERRHPPAIRNWSFSGQLLKAMQILSARKNQAVIGFVEKPYSYATFSVDPVTGKKKFMQRMLKSGITTNSVAYINNNRVEQLGVSPRDGEVLVAAVLNEFNSATASKVA